MTQPDRPDRAAAEQLRHDRVAEQLRHAAQSYEPDGERIRRLIEARSVEIGGVPISTRESRGLGGRAVMWPVLGSAAAAAVILAVAASGATPTNGTEQPASGGGTVTLSSSPSTDGSQSSPPSPSTTLSTAVSTTLSPTGSPTPTGSSGGRSASGRGTVTTTTTASGGAAPRDSSVGAAAAPTAAGGSTPTGDGSAPVQTSATLGGRQLTAVVQAVTAGQEVSLGGAGEQWFVSSSTSSQTQSVGSDNAIGPVQAMVPTTGSESGPFRVQWQNGAPNATGSTATWVTAAAAASAGPSLRVPIRFKRDPSTIVLYVGTSGGGGRMEITYPGHGALRVTLPSCSGTCGSIVTITSRGVGADVPSTGDLQADLFAIGTSRIGVAAGTLS